MEKLKIIIIFYIMVCLALMGCSKNESKVDVNTILQSSATLTSEKQTDKNTDKFVLNVWNSSIDKNQIEQFFKELYPKASINIVNIDGGDSEAITKALASGNAPDIVIYNSDKFGNFNAMDGFEDLSQTKYKIGELKSLFNQKELEQCMSLDEKKLIALPFTTGSMVTYYRTDILEQHGVTTDPNELGNLMEKPEGWLTIAKKLKNDNIFALQWKDEFIKMALSEYGYFDKDMKLNVDNEKIREAVGVSIEAYNSGLIDNYDIWTESGRQAVKDGKIAMLYLNRWGEDTIKEIAPETAGKWRAARLPLGMYSYSGTNNISIVSSSKYKIQAWNLVKKLIQEDRRYYASIREEEDKFLGNQKSKLLYEELANKLPRRYPTMLDDKVYSIFMDSTNTGVDKDTDVYNFINLTKLKINNSIYVEQKVLSEYVKENEKH